MRRRLVIGAVLDLFGPVLLLDPAPWVVVRVCVTDAVADARCRAVVRVAQVRGHRARPVWPRRLRARPRCRARCGCSSGAVARCTTACARFSCASGRPTYSTACAAAVATTSAIGSAMPDVFAGEDHEAAGDEARVLAGGEHAGEPVEPGVGVAAADRLDERRDDVVVIVAFVPQRAGAARSFGVLERDVAIRGQQAIATSSEVSRARPSPSTRLIRWATASASAVASSASRPRWASTARSSSAERLQTEQRRARQQRRVDFEVRVLRRRADERERAVLHRRAAARPVAPC